MKSSSLLSECKNNKIIHNTYIISPEIGKKKRRKIIMSDICLLNFSLY